MKTSKKQLIEAFNAEGGLRSIKVGSRLFIFDRESEVKVTEQVNAYAIRSGEMIYRNDGVLVFYKWTPVENANQTGSNRFDWHDDGNRVRQALQRVTIVKGHEPLCVTIREAFRKLEVV